MERFAWKGYILPDKKEEYIKRHDEIWPEMTTLLNDAGIYNYTIWNIGDELFGYYECESVEKAQEAQATSPVVESWNEFMEDVMYMAKDENDEQVLPTQIFLHP